MREIDRLKPINDVVFWAGIIGLGIMALGVFAPFISVPLLGSMSYFQNAKGDGAIILVLVAIGVIFWMLKKPLIILLTSIGSSGILIFDIVGFLAKKEEIISNMQKELQGNPFAGLAEIATNSIQLQWGVGVIVFGILITIVASILAIISVSAYNSGVNGRKRDIDKFLNGTSQEQDN